MRTAILFVATLAMFSLSACAPASSPQLPPTATVDLPMPTDTATPTSTATAVPPTATVEPSPTIDPVEREAWEALSDEQRAEIARYEYVFDESLGEFTIVREDGKPARYNLEDAALFGAENGWIVEQARRPIGSGWLVIENNPYDTTHSARVDFEGVRVNNEEALRRLVKVYLDIIARDHGLRITGEELLAGLEEGRDYNLFYYRTDTITGGMEGWTPERTEYDPRFVRVVLTGRELEEGSDGLLVGWYAAVMTQGTGEVAQAFQFRPRGEWTVVGVNRRLVETPEGRRDEFLSSSVIMMMTLLGGCRNEYIVPKWYSDVNQLRTQYAEVMGDQGEEWMLEMVSEP